MKRILLVSDTHGNVDLINELTNQIKTDLVIHAGDFGFYDEESIRHLSPRELRLLITHSPFKNQYNVTKQSDQKSLKEIVLKHHLLGDFSDYLSGKKQFAIPIYAVWGNHEDAEVIKKLRNELSIKNLHLLDENNFYKFEQDGALEFSLYGLGGNFLVSKKLFDTPVAGKNGKVWSTLHQFGTLYQNVIHKGKASIFVSHVSPGKEPLLTALITHFMPNFWISGHMGAPFTCVWNQFTIRKIDEALAWMQTNIDDLIKENGVKNISPEATLAIEIIKRPILKKDYWFKRMWNINLPDAKDGYAVLNYDAGRFALETYSRGVMFFAEQHVN